MRDKRTSDDVFYDKLIEKLSEIDKKITVIMTTIPSRYETCLATFESIYRQVDEIRIVFNGYKEAPSWTIDAIGKISAFVDPSNQYTDCAKWQYLPDNGYVFSIDDDIQYPLDYIPAMINRIERYNRRAVVTVHGSFFQLPFIGFKESKRSFHFIQELLKDIQVPMIGTGTLAFHTDTIRPKFEDFKESSRSDIWFSALCLKQNIPMVCIARLKKWLIPLATNDDTIWNKTMADKEFLNRNSELIAEHIIPYISSEIVYMNELGGLKC